MAMAEAARRRRGGGRALLAPPNRSLSSLVLLVVVVASALLPAARAALLAIDFGSENLKMCLVKPGRTPISIVVNEFSRRKSPSLVGVIAGDRVVGEEGSTMAVKRPQEVFLRTRDLLGRRADDPYLKELMDAHLLPYELAPHPRRGGAAALVAPPGALEEQAGGKKGGGAQEQEPALFPPEELVASVLQYAREAAEIYSGGGKAAEAAAGGGADGKAKKKAEGAIVDAVLAVPAWWGLEQRRALADAAALAGLNVLALINGHSAAALQYGIERDFSGGKDKEQLVLLFDVGAGSTEAALVRFSAYHEGGGGRASGKAVNQFEVLDAEWDASAGANDLDALLMRHFAAEFDAKHPPAAAEEEGGGGDESNSGGGKGGKGGGKGVLSSPKAVAKLRRQVRRTKEILSANAAAPFSAEELHNGVDFSATISRDELERLAAPWFARVAAVAERLLARQGVNPPALSAVELLGGGSRVPGLQAALSKALGGRALDRHLDADEAIALGAGLFAANLSSTFRLRKFGMADAAPYGVEFESLDLELPAAAAAGAAGGGGGADLEQEEAALSAAKGESSDAEASLSSSSAAAAAAASGGGGVVRALLPPGKRLPARRAVKFHNLTADAFTFSLRYNASSPRGLPPGVRDPLLARYTVSGIQRAVERYGGSGQTVLRFEADHGGRVELAGAECVVERDEPEEREVLDEELWRAAVGAATEEAAKRAAEDEAAAKAEEEAKKGEEAKKKDEEPPAADKGEAGGANATDAKTTPPPPPKTPRNLTAEYVAAAIANLTRPMKNVTFTRTRTYRVALDVSPALPEGDGGAAEGAEGAGKKKGAAAAAVGAPAVAAAWARPPLMGEALEEARATVAAWRARELKKRENAKARNDLEAHVIATREALGDEGGDGEDGGGGAGDGGDGDASSSSSSSLSPLRRASTPAERAALREALMDAEDWLYSDEGGRAGADALRARLDALRALGAKAERRAKDLVARPARVREARDFLAAARAEAAAWAESRPWITAAEAKKATGALDALEKWLAAQEAAQKKKKGDSEDAAFSAADVEAKAAEAAAAFRAVADKPKPAEPKKKAEKKSKAKAATKEEAEADGAAEGQQQQQQQKQKQEEAQKEEGGGEQQQEAPVGDDGSGTHDEL